MPETTPSRDELIKIHSAEYQGLTSRWSSLLTVMFAMWALAFAYLGFVIHIWSTSNRALVLWSAVLIEQTIAFAWLNLLLEQYRIILYMETDLRTLIEELGVDKPFWHYERFLANRPNRYKFLSRVWEWAGAALSSGALIGALAYRLAHDRSWWDLIPLSLSLLLVIVTVKAAQVLIGIRKERLAASKTPRKVSDSKEGAAISAAP